jgi:hypothetical protein
MAKLISDLKKGDRVLLTYGEQNGDMADAGTFERYMAMKDRSSFKPWEAIVKANPRGKQPTVVFLEVHGWENDLGDTYAHKIMAFWNGTGWEKIEHTPKQIEMKKLEASMF